MLGASANNLEAISAYPFAAAIIFGSLIPELAVDFSSTLFQLFLGLPALLLCEEVFDSSMRMKLHRGDVDLVGAIRRTLLHRIASLQLLLLQPFLIFDYISILD